MYENTQDRSRTPAAGITDGVVELRKRRPSAVGCPAAERTAPAADGGGRGPAPEPPGTPAA
ncbi:hypothetical protein AB0F18_20125 [Streptomyces sp. NPDC029216]|uniref:hypothetical protein n=1 Tax=Streptomyces sp. NPDC029216 TaxID=3154701 RepID=UPI0033DE4B37